MIHTVLKTFTLESVETGIYFLGKYGSELDKVKKQL